MNTVYYCLIGLLPWFLLPPRHRTTQVVVTVMAFVLMVGVDMRYALLPPLFDIPERELQIGAQVNRVFLFGVFVSVGIIGAKKFSYDLWGDTVNVASRMESHGAVGRIHVSKAVRDQLAHKHAFESRGKINVKGKGEMETFFLHSPQESRDGASPAARGPGAAAGS